MTTRHFLAAAVAAAGVIGVAGAAHALTLIDPGKATAALSYDAGTGDLTVALTNLVDDPSSAAQEISGIQIIFANSSSPTDGSLDSQAGTIVEWDSKNPLTWSYPGGSPDHWASSLSGQDLHLTTLSGAKPYDLITGAGPSFTGNASIFEHTPSILQVGTFVVDIGANGPFNVAEVIFEYGTGPDSSDPIYCRGEGGCGITGVPEPASWALMLIGFGGLGATLRRRRAALAA